MNKTFTLWRLLHQQEIIVPMVQRDYAQGRVGKEHIRSAFLKDVQTHLVNGENLTLDFVYGNTENGKFHPLDGQQRLTTLWLIHWYIAFRLNKLKDVKETLKNFSYQTRRSSADFCKMLCDKMSETDEADVDNIADYIKQQTWFFSEWMQDPTVSAMLRTLSGDRNGNQEDHIQGVFCRDQLRRCWDNLTTQNVITFKLMIIGTEKLPISDDLYIKMNARGKKLTDFENFKADWIVHIQNTPELSQSFGNYTYAQYYPKQIDGAWTDVFWNSRKYEPDFDGNIDSVFFSFINRFVLNQLCISGAAPATHYNSGKHTPTDDATKQLQKKFDTLYGTGLGKKKGGNDDSRIEYKGFDVYREFLTPDNLKTLDTIFTQLTLHAHRLTDLNFSGVDEDEETDDATYRNRTYHFLPQYTAERGVVSTSLKERIYFHAICLFLEKPIWEQLGNWKRIVWNITENAGVENIEAMINCLCFIHDLGLYLRERDWEIYKHLPMYTSAVPARFSAQWTEEQEKAAVIFKDGTMLPLIEKAEAYAFFKGTVRFLFTDPNGQVDWGNFATKFQQAQKLFANKDKVSADTIKHFLSMFESFEELGHQNSYFFTTEGYHPRYNCWKKGILCNTDTCKQVDALLMDRQPVAKDEYREFLESGAVNVISRKSHNYNYRYHSSKDIGVHRDYSSTEGIYTGEGRRKKNRILLVLQHEGHISVDAETTLTNDFLWGKEISFSYQGKSYRWLLDWDGRNWIEPATDAKTALEWTDHMDKEDLLQQMQTLHRQNF